MTPPTVTVDREGTVTGNTYDKYGSTNPLVRRLMAGFERTLDELFDQADPASLLDVGCGEGVLTHRWAQRLGERRIELQLGVAPSHYEPGAGGGAGQKPTTGADAGAATGKTEERDVVHL